MSTGSCEPLGASHVLILGLRNEQEISMAISVKAIAGAAAALAIATMAGVTIVTTTSQEACAARGRRRASPRTCCRSSAARCFGCHSPGGEGEQTSGLDLTTYAGVMKGTKYGAMVIARDPDGSNLMWLLDRRGKPQTWMPHGGKKLSTCDRDAIRSWIREGAKNN